MTPSSANLSSDIKEGMSLGAFPITHCDGEKPPALLMSFLVLVTSVKIDSTCSFEEHEVSAATFLNMAFNNPP